MEPTIFSKIITGELPAHKLYEDDKTLAFLDIHPAQPGHTLVIPKTQVEFVWDLENDDYAALMATTKLIALQLRQILGVPYVGQQVVGVDVPHAHVHLIPFSVVEEYRHIPDMNSEPDHAFLAQMAEKLRIQ